MSRFVLLANENAVEGSYVPYLVFVDLDFVSGHVRLGSGNRSYTFGGNTYEAVGKLGGVGPVKENGNLSPTSIELQLSGVDQSLITSVQTEHYFGRSAKMYVGYIHHETHNLLDTPEQIWEGFMSQRIIRMFRNGASIAMICESDLIRWGKAAGWLYTFEHQREFDATDNFLDQIATLQNKIVKWGGGSIAGSGRTPREQDPARPPGRAATPEERGK